jgi:hypothetical protein
MLAYKFLRSGAVAPFSDYRWPTPVGSEAGAWVGAAGDRGVCRDGVHACEVARLPLWIWEELWEIELEGPVDARPHKLRAPRGRLLAKVDAWSASTAKAFAIASAGRAAQIAAGPLRDSGNEEPASVFEAGEDLEAVRELATELWDRLPREAQLPVGMASDGALRALTAADSDDPYVAAHGAAVTGYIAAMTAHRVASRPAHDRERAIQAEWLRRELELSA